MKRRTIVDGIGAMLLSLPKESIDEEWLDNTPARVAAAFEEMTSGYLDNPASILSKQFDLGDAGDQIVLVRDLPFVSLCAHHLLPFHGTAHIAYVPRRYNVGLSKIPRLLRCRSRRLQLQESLGFEIATDIQEHLDPLGVGVVLSSTHDCMSCRGVESQGMMVTSMLLGVFRDDLRARDELMLLLRGA